MCWYRCSKQPSAFTVPQGLVTIPKGFWKCRALREKCDWCFTLSKSCHRALFLFISQMWNSKRDSSRSLLPPVAQAAVTARLSLPADGFGLQNAVKFSIYPHLIFVVARRYQYPEVCIPSVAYPETPLALGALRHQQNAPLLCLNLISGWTEEVGYFKKDFRVCDLPVEVGM